MTDELLVELARYASAEHDFGTSTLATARLVLADSLGCAALASTHQAPRRVLGPIGSGGDILVVSTGDSLDPVKAAFDTGALIRWLDFNDTWLAAEWGHPSDNLGAILSVAQHRRRTVRDVLHASIVAHEIQGVLALENSFNRVGLDHVLLVKVASTAAAGRLLGLDERRLVAAISHAWLDGHALRVYRHAPNTGPRKSWAAGDATARGVWLALLAERGEPGYASALTAPTWGFQDALFRGEPVRLPRGLGSYVMDNVLFKVSYPAEFHAQTAAEAAVALHPHVRDRVDEVERIEIATQESAIRIIDKRGELRNPADRDHCLQYVTVVALLNGTLADEHYEDAAAADPRIDALRERCVVSEDPRYSAEYLDPDKRSIANAVQVFFRDGTATGRIEVEYPLGHPRRRAEALEPLRGKLHANLAAALGEERADELTERLLDDPELPAAPARELVESLAP
ncbi:MAG TPA: bifunctional 2-methylcitrate dehydratase/aconitate hydratase [Gaiellaceae bacterium]|nr:bifunctional 2-methylcitrate dehydratase/aconitate hydratase [Gaiellaceae bacterium]